MKRHLRTALALGIVALTIASFAYYLANHPETVRQIGRTPPITLVALVLLYGFGFIMYTTVAWASLQMYRKHIGTKENFLFNAYSSLINFFGPGQSGPIFRGAYLKKRHGLSIKSYMFTLLVYYAFYAVISVAMMFAGSRPWWQTAALTIAAGAGCVLFMAWYKRRNAGKMEQHGLDPRIILIIFIVTLLQLVAQAVTFGIELHNVSAHVSTGQVLAYTGVANFSLFVALTPGAIGIREAFLLFSERLHHIGSNAIVAANVVDRASYLVMLGVLFILVLALHAKTKLRIKQLDLEK